MLLVPDEKGNDASATRNDLLLDLASKDLILDSLTRSCTDLIAGHGSLRRALYVGKR